MAPSLYQRVRVAMGPGQDMVTLCGSDWLAEAASRSNVSPFELALAMRYLEATTADRTRSEQRELARSILPVAWDGQFPGGDLYLRKAARTSSDIGSLLIADLLPLKREVRRKPGRTLDHVGDVIKVAAYQLELEKGKRRTNAAQDASRRLGVGHALGGSRHATQKPERRLLQRGALLVDHVFKNQERGVEFMARLILEAQTKILEAEEAMRREHREEAEERRKTRHVRPISARISPPSSPGRHRG